MSSRLSSWKSRIYALQRRYSTVLRLPPKSAPRECPTPLVFVSAREWDPSSAGLGHFVSALPEKGYTCLNIDLALRDNNLTDSQQLMQYFESSLRREIQLSALLFPPVIFSRSASCLIAQTYISSYPASGLFLLSPPASNDLVPKHILPTSLPEFNYEPKFPISIMASGSEISLLKKNSRLLREESVDLIEVDDTESTEALEKIELWLDDLGI